MEVLKVIMECLYQMLDDFHGEKNIGSSPFVTFVFWLTDVLD